ncbi:MAG: ABC transporter substrate-binding protein [Oscillospiraceae bacterium]|nr:ABC transporter substrate-binding protein [Oscillospiraceae bacterium]
MKRNWILLLALLLALGLCACRDTESEEAVLLPEAEEAEPEGLEPPATEAPAQYPEETEPSAFSIGYYSHLGLNPFTCDNTINRGVISLLYESLFSIGPDFAVESCLAESCQKSGSRWLLTLREGVSFWNGETMTAEDVRRSLEMAAGGQSIWQKQLAPMSGLRVEGERTLSFQWAEERGELTALLNIPVVQSGTEGETIPMGTGPYLPDLEEGTVHALSENLNWWQQLPLFVSGIELWTSEDSALLISAFEQGKVTLVTSDLTDSDSLGYSSRYEAWDYPTSHLLYLGCNTAAGPCRDQALRQALLTAIDRETIVHSLLSGHATASPLTFHPNSPWYDSQLADSLAATDDQSALERWQGEELTIVVCSESSFKTTVARYIAASLTERGLKVSVSALNWSGYQQALESGDYDLYLGEVKLKADFDPGVFLTPGESLNYSGFYSRITSDALAAWLASDADGRAAAASALAQCIAQQAPILPICFEEHSVLTDWGRVEALETTQYTLFYQPSQWKLAD